MRIGHGYDAHTFSAGRPLILGGVTIPYEKGLAAHSDGDAVIHAVCDALLGAANLRDIGFHFKNTDPRWKGADSKIFLKEVVRMLTEKGWVIGNVDCTIVLEKPKINPHIEKMKEAAIAIVMDSSGVTQGDCSALESEIAGYFDRAAAAVS